MTIVTATEKLFILKSTVARLNQIRSFFSLFSVRKQKNFLRHRRGHAGDDAEANRQLIIYEDPPESCQDPSISEHMLCTYQCRQMVNSDFLYALGRGRAENQVLDYQSQLETLNDNFQKVVN